MKSRHEFARFDSIGALLASRLAVPAVDEPFPFGRLMVLDFLERGKARWAQQTL